MDLCHRPLLSTPFKSDGYTHNWNTGNALAVVLNILFLTVTGHHVDPPVQTNQAYVTVVRSSRKIKTQPCPAYELAVIES